MPQVTTQMAVSRATALFALTLAALCCGSASARLLDLGIPLLSSLPPNCGFVYQVQGGDSCQNIA